MNSHERRVCNRRWPHCVTVSNGDDRYSDIFEWLYENFGNCSLARRRPPRWVWRKDYSTSHSMTEIWDGTQVFFRHKEDYAWFLLKWDAE